MVLLYYLYLPKNICNVDNIEYVAQLFRVAILTL